MKSSEGPVQEASWQWDGDADGAAEVPGDVLDGGGRGEGGPRLSRRGLLVGAGVLAAGGAVWALGRTGGDRPTPQPQPTSLSGPKPLWTYRGPQAMTPERLTGPVRHPVYLSKDGLQVLDPASGDPRRLLVFDPPPAKDWPSDIGRLSRVALGPEHLFTATSKGHLDAHHLSDPGADWSLPLPPELKGDITLSGVEDDILYGRAVDFGQHEENRLFAVHIKGRSLLWNVRTDGAEQLITPPTGYGDILACVRSLGDHAALVARKDYSGAELWSVPGAEGLRWCVTGLQAILVPDGNGGVRMLDSADGKPLWTHSPARGESWRALPPLLGSGRVYVPRDNGVVSSHDPSTGEVLWSYRLPFLLDLRSRPLVVGGVLFVPGPAAGGVAAIQTATGRKLWTFQDSGPGRDVWSLAADGTHLYAGHDDVLHALPLS